MNKFCYSCGNKLPQEALFCPSCGAKQAVDIISEQPDTAPAETVMSDTAENPQSGNKKTVIKKEFIPNIIRSSILLLFSIVILIMSFLPVFSVKQALSPEVSLEVKVSALDGVAFLFDSLYELDSYDLEDTSIAEDIDDLSDEMADEDVDYQDEDSITRAFKKYFSKFTILTARLLLRSEEFDTHLNLVILAVTCLIYIIFAVLLVLFATFSFICSFGIMANKKKSFDRLALGFLAAIPAIALLTYSAFVLYSPFNANRYAMAGGAICMIVFASVAIILSAVYAFLFKKHECNFNIPLRALTLVFSIAIIILALSPVVTTSIRTKFSGRNQKVTVDVPISPSIYNEYHLSEEVRSDWEDNYAKTTLKYKQSIAEDQFDYFKRYTKKGMTNGSADLINKELLLMLTGFYFVEGPLEIVSYVSLFYFILIGIAAAILFETTFRFIAGKSLVKTLFSLRILNLIFAILALASGIAFTVYAHIFIERYAPTGYSVSFGIGIAFALALAIAILTFPDEAKKQYHARRTVSASATNYTDGYFAENTDTISTFAPSSEETRDHQSSNVAANNADKSSIGLYFISALVPLFGIVYWAIRCKEAPQEAQNCGLISIVAGAFAIFIGFMIAILAII